MKKTESLSVLRTELRNARSAIDAIRHQSDERLILLERYAQENAELKTMVDDLCKYLEVGNMPFPSVNPIEGMMF